MTKSVESPIFTPSKSRVKPSAVPSPCVNICSIGRDGICVGCARTLPEIGEWASASDERKRAIMNLVSSRKS